MYQPLFDGGPAPTDRRGRATLGYERLRPPTHEPGPPAGRRPPGRRLSKPSPPYPRRLTARRLIASEANTATIAIVAATAHSAMALVSPPGVWVA